MLAQWAWQNPKPTGNDLYDVSFAGETSVGWFVGKNGTIFKTTNAGTSWREQSIDPQYDFTCLYALDPNHVWAATGLFEDLYTYDYFKIFYSCDGGNSWLEQLDGAQLSSDTLNLRHCSIWSLAFINEFSGCAVGDSGLVLRTTDGGSHWNLHMRVRNNEVKTVQFLDDTLGFICGGLQFPTPNPEPTTLSVSRGIVLTTIDGGGRWDTLYADTLDIHRAYFRSATLGWALGTSAWIDTFHESTFRNFILKTSDRGNSWQKLFLGTSIAEDMFFTDDLPAGWWDRGGGVADNDRRRRVLDILESDAALHQPLARGSLLGWSTRVHCWFRWWDPADRRLWSNVVALRQQVHRRYH